jgi:hypothetical protein
MNYNTNITTSDVEQITNLTGLLQALWHWHMTNGRSEIRNTNILAGTCKAQTFFFGVGMVTDVLFAMGLYFFTPEYR